MLTLGESHELANLRDEVSAMRITLKRYKTAHGEVQRLQRENAKLTDELRKARNSKIEWKAKYTKIAGKKLTKTDRARIMVKHTIEKGYEGSRTNECKRIADVLKMKWHSVYNLWYEKTPIE